MREHFQISNPYYCDVRDGSPGVVAKNTLINLCSREQKEDGLTANQINYWALQETKRSNQIKEQETQRSNQAKEYETNRANTTKEAETARHNREAETVAGVEAGAKVAKTIIDSISSGTQGVSGLLSLLGALG